MKLTEEEFSGALKSLRCGDYAIIAESRGRARVPMGTRVSIVPIANASWGAPETVVLLNISESGVGILSVSPMDEGETFVLCLPAAPGKAASAVLCTVVRTQPFATGMFANGAQFSRLLEPQETTKEGPVFKTIEEIEDLDLNQVRQLEDRLSKFEVKLD